jgi:hypothetical protein
MGEAARRKQQGFDGRRLGETVLEALNEDAGGNVWESFKDTEAPEHFLILNQEDHTARTGMVTNGEASATPHRLVTQTLVRRGEPWVAGMIFDPSEEYRPELFDALARRALRVAREHGADDVDEVLVEIIHSDWSEQRGYVRRSLSAAALEDSEG